VFGIPGMKVDGMDVRAVKAAGQAAIARVRAGAGPMILEMRTYRYRGHSMSDPAKYRSRAEVQEMRTQRDPIELVGKRLSEAGIADEDRLKEIDKSIRAIVNEAADFATSDPEPEASELHTDVVALP
jgi:pyruvate dehydrogenase E1 component alpha subunit